MCGRMGTLGLCSRKGFICLLWGNCLLGLKILLDKITLKLEAREQTNHIVLSFLLTTIVRVKIYMPSV